MGQFPDSDRREPSIVNRTNKNNEFPIQIKAEAAGIIKIIAKNLDYLVIAYSFNPEWRGRGSKLPMQPRRRV
jgi:hypothetical protein